MSLNSCTRKDFRRLVVVNGKTFYVSVRPQRDAELGDFGTLMIPNRHATTTPHDYTKHTNILDIIFTTLDGTVKIRPIVAKYGNTLRARKAAAFAIQKAERAALRNTDKPKRYGQYDGTDNKQTFRDEFPEHAEDTQLRIDAMRGRRGFDGYLELHGRKITSTDSTLNYVEVVRRVIPRGYPEPKMILFPDGFVRQVHASYKISPFNFEKQR